MKYLILMFVFNLSTAFGAISADNREGKKIAASLGYGWNYSATSINPELIYHTTPSETLSFRYSNANIDKDRLRAYTFLYRKFLGESFYVSPLIYYRDFKRTSDDMSQYFRDFGLGGNIGNQWQSKNFLVGADWFGLFTSAAQLKQVGNPLIDKKFGVSAFFNFYFGYKF